MGDGLRIEITGLDAFVEAFAEIGGDRAEELRREANREASVVVVRAARPLAPRRSGRLAATLRSASAAHGGVMLVGSVSVAYASVIIYGSVKRNIKPNPFPFRAMENEAQTVHDIYYRKLGELLESVGDE